MKPCLLLPLRFAGVLSQDRCDRFRHEDAIYAAEVTAEVKLRMNSRTVGNLPKSAFGSYTRNVVTIKADASQNQYSVRRQTSHKRLLPAEEEEHVARRVEVPDSAFSTLHGGIAGVAR